MNIIELAAWISFVLLTVGAFGAIYRIVRGPATLDRAIATDVLLITISSGLVIWMALNKTSLYIVFVVAASVIGFVGSVTLARFTVDGALINKGEKESPHDRERILIRPVTPESAGQQPMLNDWERDKK